MATRTETTLRQLRHDAHPLRDDVGGGLDYLRRPTAGRITYGAAVAKYGRRVVHAAMRAGEVRLEGVVNRGGAAFDPANTTPETRLCANGVQVG
jgi:hypothetical protein